MENTAQLTEAWKEVLIGKTIDDVSLHMLAEHYIEYEEGRIWISDGGFEIRSGESHFSFCFHDESGNFAFHAQPLTDFMEGFDHYEVDLSESVPYLKIKGTTITDLNVRWSGYEVHDYDGSVQEKIDIPVEFLISLDDGQCIQLATVEFTLSPETAFFTKLDYNIEGNMFVCLGEKMEMME
ncbi:MAG: hypothetical protein IPH94_12695 [Saprospiraceae bacterium]|nr:hypothetical protein [Saprospiraceae bacterium]